MYVRASKGEDEQWRQSATASKGDSSGGGGAAPARPRSAYGEHDVGGVGRGSRRGGAPCELKAAGASTRGAPPPLPSQGGRHHLVAVEAVAETRPQRNSDQGARIRLAAGGGAACRRRRRHHHQSRAL